MTVPKPASPEDHQAAERYLTVNAVWCDDLAWKHALTLTRPRLRPGCSIEVAAEGEQRARVQLAAVLRAIASRLYFLPTMPLSPSQQVSAQKAKENYFANINERARREQDLLAVCRDPSLSAGESRAARRHFRACRYQFRKYERKLLNECFASSSARSLGRLSHAKKFHDRLCAPGGEEAFFAWLDRLIQRYLRAKLRGEPWIKSEPKTSIPEKMSLPQLLALAWSEGQTSQSEKPLVRRGREGYEPAHPLHAFLQACLMRWENTTPANGTHQQDLFMHHALSEGVYEEQNGKLIGPRRCTQKELPEILTRMGAVTPDQKKEGLKLSQSLRVRSFRSIRDAKAAGFRVTRPARPD